jgi:hypothetical protein
MPIITISRGTFSGGKDVAECLAGKLGYPCISREVIVEAAAMKQLAMTSHQAETYIRKVDKERERWTQFLYGVAWADPGNYDVVLNLERLGIPGACAAVLRLAALEMFQPTEESLAAMQNLALSRLVLAALARDERTRDGSFRVQAAAGVVSVEGMVRVPEIAESVPAVAGAVDGVTALVNNVVLAGYPV